MRSVLTRSRLSLPVVVALLVLRSVPAIAQGTDPNLRRLESEIARLSTISGGKVGVGIIHLETGRELFVNGAEPFPMASTVKVPIAVELLTRVQAGTVRLDSMITVRPNDLHPGSGTLTGLFNDPGVSLSVHNLLELMLLISDNSATDMVLKVAGNGPAVNSRLSALGIKGISVDRPTIHLIADAVGVKNLGPESGWSLAVFDSLRRMVTPGRAAGGEGARSTRTAAIPPPRRHGAPPREDLARRGAGAGTHGAAPRHHAPLRNRRDATQGPAAAGGARSATRRAR